MESDTITIDQIAKDCTDVGPLATVRDVEEATGSIAADCDCETTSKCAVGTPMSTTQGGISAEGLVPVVEPQKKEEGKEFSGSRDLCMSGISVLREAEEQNDTMDSSDSTTSGKSDEDIHVSAYPPLDTGDEAKSSSVCLEQQEITTETEVDTIDVPPMFTQVSTNDSMGSNTAAHEKAEAAHLSPHRKGLRPRSMNNKVYNETAAIDPVSHHQNKVSSRSARTDQQRSSSLTITSLPIDSLHSIASFLPPIQWRNFGQCNKTTNKICKEIFRRVRMHGFRCATEVVTAWKFGQHADAKELCALYISSGVPIYPHSLGHSYHTLVWRLKIEAKQLQEKQEEQQENTKNISSPNASTLGETTSLNVPNLNNSSPFDPSAGISAVVDPFYNERDDFRFRTTEELIDGLGQGGLTYLEEKSLYKLNANAKGNQSREGIFTRSNWRRTSLDQSHWRARNPLPGGLHRPQGIPQAARMSFSHFLEVAGEQLAPNHWSSPAGTGHGANRRRTRSNSFSGNRYRAPNVSLKIHRHLLDQHLLGRSGVDDFEGTMTTPSVSLSADFFHPFFSFRPPEEANRCQSDGTQCSTDASATNSLLPAYHLLPPATMQQMDNRGNLESIGQPSIPTNMAVYDSDSDAETELVSARPIAMETSNLNNGNEMMGSGELLEPPPLALSATASTNRTRRQTITSADFIPGTHTIPQVTSHHGLLSNIDLDVYSASSGSLKSDNNDVKEQRLMNYLKARFTVYHCCLERHLLNNDDDGFEETIMDFWDEFFTQTANIHYYDRHTAVPRISRLESFLTKPCPKQIGIIQCEIERVKLNSKKKGVNMKGRFFPTYEYRLFIRHHPSEPNYDFNEGANGNKNVRRDTVLMMAKNRGRKYSDSTAQASKKGSNNYYLSLPQQDDLNLHYKNANELNDPQENSPNGIGTRSGSSEFSGLLGRLQSNFVGTEFQIFTPRSAIRETKSHFFSASPISASHSISSGVTSNDDMLLDDGRTREINSMSSPRTRNRRGRLSFKGRRDDNSEIRTELSEPFQQKPSPLNLRRSRSSDATRGRNRKVSAAESFFESQHFKAEVQRTFFEEEDGAITYTANLLGSRPRIMDVCIPKVNPDGTGVEWRRYLENCKDQDTGSSFDRLLNHLKQMQQNSQMDDHGRVVNPANNDPEVHGTEEQTHSPPSDYGLLALQNRPPWWNVELGSFVLNFGGRVSVASVKNFQLCDRNDQDHIMLQFGRIEGRHSFTMDFQYPLTAVQAFAIAISSLQSKISFG